jgi:hypothetical protein
LRQVAAGWPAGEIIPSAYIFMEMVRLFYCICQFKYNNKDGEIVEGKTNYRLQKYSHLLRIISPAPDKRTRFNSPVPQGVWYWLNGNTLWRRHFVFIAILSPCFLSEISKERAAERLTLTHYFQRKREQKPRDWPEREMEIVPRIARCDAEKRPRVGA